MERQAFNNLNEAALQVQNEGAADASAAGSGKPKKKKVAVVAVNEVDIPDMVFEYFDNYFGDNLNEDTSDEDIMQAVYDLIDLTEAVLEAAALSTPAGIRRRITRTNKLFVGLQQKRNKIADSQLGHMNSGNIDAVGKNMDRMRKIDKRVAKNQDRFTQAQRHRHDAGMPVIPQDIAMGHRGWHPDANFGTNVSSNT